MPEVVVLTPHVRPKAASEKHAFGGRRLTPNMLKIRMICMEKHIWGVFFKGLNFVWLIGCMVLILQ